MNKSLLIALLLCVSAVYSTDSTIKQLEQINKSEFGKTLLDTIDLELEANSPVESLVKQLAYIESQLQSDQRKSDQAHSAYQDKCDADIKFFEETIARLTQHAQDLEEEIAIKKPILAQKIQRRDSLIDLTRATRKEIADAHAQRKKEVALYDRKVAEHQYASLVINQARKIFDKTFSSGKKVLLQTDHEACFNQLTDHFEKNTETDNFSVRKSYNDIFKILAQITSGKALRAGGMVGRVYALFKTLLQSIEDSLLQESKAENVRIKLFKQLIARLKAAIAKYTREIAKLNAEIIALQNRIREATQDYIETHRTIRLKQRQLDDRIRECDDEAEAYKNERFKRNDQSNLVSTLIGLVQSKLRQIKVFSKTRKN